MKEESKPVEKKPYVAPRLVVYGDVRLITQAMARTGVDGATMGGTFFS